MKVWVNGTFDVLHMGHVRLLEFAKNHGQVRVGIDTDERVREKKGMDRPFNTLKDRMDFLSSLKYVDSVTFFGSDEELISRIKEYDADIMVIGDDYKGKNIVGSHLFEKILFFNNVDGLSTSKILNYEGVSSWGKVF